MKNESACAVQRHGRGWRDLQSGPGTDPGNPAVFGDRRKDRALHALFRQKADAAGGTTWQPFWDVPITHGYLVDLTTGETVWDREIGLRNAIYSAYSPDGTRIAVGGRQGEVVVLDASTGEPVNPPTVAHAGDVYWVAYNSDGSRVTSGSTAHDLALWDGRTGQLLGTAVLPGSEGVSMAGFQEDGSLLVASFTGNMFVWDPSLDHAVDFACTVAGRDLTEEEWSAEFPNRPYQATCS